MRDQVSGLVREESPAAKPGAVRVLCVEDLRPVAEAIAELVDREAGLESVGILPAPDDLVAEAIRRHADVVLLDLYFGAKGSENALGAMRDLLRADPHVAVIIVTGDNHPQMVERAFALGAKGYVVKDTPRALISAIRAVIRGETRRPRQQ